MNEEVLPSPGEAGEPFEEVDKTDDQEEDEPPPDEDEDLLIEHIYLEEGRIGREEGGPYH